MRLSAAFLALAALTAPACGGSGSTAPQEPTEATTPATPAGDVVELGLDTPTSVDLTEGGTASLSFTAGSGGCFVVTAHPAGETRVELELLAALQGSAVLASSQPSGTDAVIGRDACWKNPSPIPGPLTILVRAVEGAGPVTVTVSSR